MPGTARLRAAFNRIAPVYDRHAALEQEVGRRLAARTAFRQYEPATVLDLGCGTGEGSAALKKSFRKAQVIGLDASPGMLAELRGKSRLLRPLRPVCGDLDRLPLADASVDMVFANLSTYWSTSPDSLYAEIRRVLKAGGMLLFSTLGPGTFSQLRAAWAAADDGVEVPWFPDILEVGDALARAGFSEPAMDTETITLEYRSVDALMTELESTGTSLLVRGWENWRGQVDSLAGSWAPTGAGGRLPLTYEIIYGAAFEPPESAPRKPGDGDILRISVDSLLK